MYELESMKEAKTRKTGWKRNGPSSPKPRGKGEIKPPSVENPPQDILTTYSLLRYHVQPFSLPYAKLYDVITDPKDHIGGTKIVWSYITSSWSFTKW